MENERRMEFAVKALIFKGDRFLAVHKSSAQSPKFELPGGRMLFGETVEETVIREVLEETGLHIIPLKPIDTLNYVTATVQVTGIIYLCTAECHENIVLSDEHDSYEWLATDTESLDKMNRFFQSKMLTWDWGTFMKQFPTHIVAVDGIVENSRNEILLVKNRHYDAWTIPGGQVEATENLIDALVREIKEESGVDAVVNKLVCVSSNTCTYRGYNGYGMVPTKVMFGFTCTYAAGRLCSSDETSESKWVPKERVLEYITAPTLIERFHAYLNFDGNIQYLEYITKPEYELELKRLI